jgi:cell division protein FtsQ
MSDRPLPSNRRIAPRPATTAVKAPGEEVGGLEAPPAKGKAKEKKKGRKPAEEAAAVSAPSLPRVKKAWKLPWQGKAFPTQTVLTAGRLVLGTVLFFALMGASSFGLYRYVSTTTRFAVKTISIEGAVRRGQPDIARLAGVEPGRNIFTLDLDAARRGILQDPWIERATVDRKLPGTILINVAEREATALVALGGSLFLAGRGGDLFKRLEPGDPSDFVVITGAGGEGELVRDRDGLVLLVKKAQDIIAEYERLGPIKNFPLQEVRLTDEGGVNLTVGREGILLVMGRGPYRSKIERAARVLGEVDRRKGQTSVIFLDNDAHPERVVARMR